MKPHIYSHGFNQLTVLNATDGSMLATQTGNFAKPAGPAVWDTLRLGPAYQNGQSAMELDNLVVASTWSDVVANAVVPEPSVLALIAMAFCGLTMRRRIRT